MSSVIHLLRGGLFGASGLPRFRWVRSRVLKSTPPVQLGRGTRAELFAVWSGGSLKKSRSAPPRSGGKKKRFSGGGWKPKQPGVQKGLLGEALLFQKNNKNRIWVGALQIRGPQRPFCRDEGLFDWGRFSRRELVDGD